MRHALLLVLGTLVLLALFTAGCTDGGSTPPPNNTITVTVFNYSQVQPYAPLWAAFQNGTTGAWTSIDPVSPGVFTAQVTDPAGAYGFAYAYDNGIYIMVRYLHATIADGTALNLPAQIYRDRADMRPLVDRAAARPITPGPNDWTMQGSMVNIPRVFDLLSKGDAYSVSSAFPFNTTPEPYTFVFPSGRPVDAVALLADMFTPLGDGVLYLRRNLTNAAGASVDEDIDCSAPYDGSKYTYALTEQATVTVPDAYETDMFWRTANGSAVVLGMGQGSLTYSTIPEAVTVPGDQYHLYAYDWNDRYAYAWSHAPITSLALPDYFTCGYSGMTFSGLNFPEASEYELYAGSSEVQWDAEVTSAWLAAAGSDSFTYSDPSAADGWQPAWNLTEASLTGALVYKYEYNFSLQQYLSLHTPAFMRPPPPEGAYMKTVGYRPVSPD